MTFMTFAAAMAVAFTATLLLLLAGRIVVSRLARARHWRVGRWSDILPGYGYPRCQRCGTSYFYVPAHDLSYEEFLPLGQRRTARLRALCDPCHLELGTPGARIGFYEDAWAAISLEERQAGTRPDLRDLVSIRAAVEVGL